MAVFLWKKYMSIKIERAMSRIAPQKLTPISKGERLWPAISSLEQIDPSLKEKTRQRLEGDIVGSVLKTKDVMTLLTQAELDCQWGIAPLDKIVEWSWENDYSSIEELREDFDIVPIGGSECTVEVACDPKRQDLIDIFAQKGIMGLTKYLQENGDRIATDTPGIAEYFFGKDLLLKLSGSLEALPKKFAPVIIGVVESGNSLKEENWLRLADDFPEAVLLKSELMLIIIKNKCNKNLYNHF